MPALVPPLHTAPVERRLVSVPVPLLMDGKGVTALVLAAIAARAPYVEVPGATFAQMDPRAHPLRWPWIPVSDEGPWCGEFERIADRDVERWCLLAEDHDGLCGFKR